MTIKRSKKTERHIIKADRGVLTDLKRLQSELPTQIHETMNKGRKLKKRVKTTVYFTNSGDDIVKDQITCVVDVNRNNLPHFTKA